jgi:hypothetical protein
MVTASYLPCHVLLKLGIGDSCFGAERVATAEGHSAAITACLCDAHVPILSFKQRLRRMAGS